MRARTQTTQGKTHCTETRSCHPPSTFSTGAPARMGAAGESWAPGGLRSSRCRSGGERGLLAMHKLCSPSAAWLSSSLASLACSCRALRAYQVLRPRLGLPPDQRVTGILFVSRLYFIFKQNFILFYFHLALLSGRASSFDS